MSARLAEQPASVSPEWSIRDLDAPLGALVEGIDASQPLRASQVLALKKTLQQRHVLLLRGQQLSDEQFKRFVSHFGSVFQPPGDVPVLASDPYGGNAKTIVRVANDEDGVLGNRELSAHADHHWTPEPSSGSLLYAEVVPSRGGDTVWTNLVAAYAALDEATKQVIDGLQLITYNPFLRRLHPLPDGRWPRYRTPDITPLTPHEIHPLVRTHPDTGAKAIFLDEDTEVELVGVEPTRGQELIEHLRAHIRQPRFAYTHRWQVGDIVYWDNQVTLHARTPFDASERRVLKRISLAGSRPF